MTAKRHTNRELLLAKLTLDFMSDAVYWIAKDARIAMVNQAAVNNLGYSRDELLSMLAFDIDPGYLKEKWETDWRTIITGSELVFDAQHTRKDNTSFPVQIRANNAEFEGEKFICIVARDITEQKKAESILVSSESRYRSLFEGANDAIFIMEGDKFIECNSKTLEIFGVEQMDEIIGHSPWEFSPEFQPEGQDSYKEAKDLIKKAYEGKPQRFYWKHTKKDGTEFDAEISLNRLEIGEKRNLLHAIVRDISDLVKVKDEIQESESTIRALLNAPTDTLILIETDGTIMELNESAAKSFGKKREKLIGTNVFDIFPPDIAKARQEIGVEVAKTRKSVRFEDKRGDRHFDNNLIPVLDESGKVSRIAVFARDITDEKEAAKIIIESEEKFSKVFHNSPISLHITTLPDGKFVDVNPMFEKISGYKRKELIGKTSLEMGFYTDPIERDTAINKLKTEGKLEDYEISFRVKSGDSRMCLLNSEIIEFKGQLHLLSMVLDITEQRRAEKDLRDSEEKFRTMIETSPDAVTTSNLDGKLTYVSKKTAELHGFDDPEELLGTKALDLFIPEDRQKAIENIEKTITKGSLKDVEYSLLRKNGSSFYGELSGSLIKDTQGNPSGFIAITKDITNRKKAENALRESEERYRLLIENIPSVVWKTNKDGITSFISTNVKKVYGYAPDQLYKGGSKLWFDRIHPDDRERIGESFRLLFEKRKEYSEEYRIKKRSGEWIWLHDRASEIYEEKGEIYAYGVFSDITDRKRIEETLKDSEEKYSTAFYQSPDSISIIRAKDQKYIDVNKGFTTITGYSKKEAIGKGPFELSLFNDPASYEIIREAIVEKKGIRNFEMSIRSKSGKIRQCLFLADVIEINQLPHILTITRDITHQKEAHEELKESETRFRTLAESAFDGIGISENQIIIDASKNLTKMLRYQKNKLIGKKVMDLVAPESRETVTKHLQLGLNKPYEHLAIRKDGSTFPVEVHGQPIPYKGKDARITAIRDISERKQAEEALRESEVKFRSMVENINEIIFIYDKDLVFQYMSDQVEDIFGYSAREMIGESLLSILADSELNKDLVSDISESFKKGKIKYTTYRVEIRHKNGDFVIVETTNNLLKDDKGMVTGIIGSARDKTKQIIMEQEQQQYQQALKKMVSELTLAEERERRRIAEDLHDHMSQSLAMAKITLTGIDRSDVTKDVLAKINNSTELISDAIGQSRSLTYDLSPPILYELGLIPALQWNLDKVAKRNNMEREMKSNVENLELSQDNNVLLYRAVNELFTNIVKHSKATRISIEIDQKEDYLYISVEDNGIGYDVQKSKRKSEADMKFGLFSVRERIELMTGKLEIESEKGKGTRTSIILPR